MDLFCFNDLLLNKEAWNQYILFFAAISVFYLFGMYIQRLYHWNKTHVVIENFSKHLVSDRSSYYYYTAGGLPNWDVKFQERPERFFLHLPSDTLRWVLYNLKLGCTVYKHNYASYQKTIKTNKNYSKYIYTVKSLNTYHIHICKDEIFYVIQVILCYLS